MNVLQNKVFTLLILALFGASLFLFTGCPAPQQQQEQPQTTEKPSQPKEEPAAPKTGKKVEMVYVNWAEGIAMTNLAKIILEEKMGYEVTIQSADVAPVYASLAKGDKDIFLDGWLPVTHADYMEEFKGKLDDLGYNYEGARIGLVVPSYVTINSIEELNDHKDKFDGKIVGIDSGAGIMKATDKAIEDYGLDLTLLPSSGPAMTASLKDAVAKEEWVAVTGWKPHWKFARWDLKFLEDPKGVYGDVENIHTIARNGLREDMPDVAQFFINFKLDDQQLGSLMGVFADNDGEPADFLQPWITEHQDLIDSWIPKKDEATEEQPQE